VFTPKGLGSYSWQALAGQLSVSDAYRLLSLFGLQSSTSLVPTMAPAGEVEHHMMDISPMVRDIGHKVCVIYGPNNYVCESRGGSMCSKACD